MNLDDRAELERYKIRDFVYARQRFSAGGKDNAYYGEKPADL